MLRVLLVGYSKTVLHGLDRCPGEYAVTVLEEPDVWRGKDLAGRVQAHPSFADVVFARYQQDEEYLTVAAGLPPMDAILPGMEYAVPAAARLAEHFERRGAGAESAEILRDKLLLRSAAEAAGMQGPRFAEITGPDGIAAFLRDGPCVVKPAQRQASLGVLVLGPGDDATEAWRECLDTEETGQLADRPMRWRHLVETYLSGPEYSTECLVADGDLVWVNVTGKQTMAGRHPVEVGHVVPGWPAERTDPWDAALHALIAATGFRSGFLHAEWLLTPAGPALVECAGRLPGDFIVELIDTAYQINLVDEWVRLMAGRPVRPRPARSAAGAAIRYLVPPPGTVERVLGLEAARRVPGVLRVEIPLSAGAVVRQPRSSWDRSGFAIAAGATPDAARASAAAAIAAVQVRHRAGGAVVPRPVPAGGDAQPGDPLRGRTLLVLGSSSPTAAKPGLYEAARRRGVRVVLVQDVVRWERDRCAAVLTVDCVAPADRAAVVAEIVRFAGEHDVSGVITTADAALPVLARAAAATGLPGPPAELVDTMLDKASMRRRFTELDLPSARSIVATSPAEVEAAAERLGMPVVVKPATGTGSVGVLLAATPAEVRAADRLIRRTGRDRVMVEQFLTGPEVCVDALVHDGRVLFTYIVDKPVPMVGPMFEELEFVTPTALDPHDAAAVHQLSDRLVAGLGLSSGVAHTEVRITPDGPRLVESHLRLPGQRLPEIVSAATGVDLFGAAIELALGVAPSLTPRDNGYAGYRCIYTGRSGTIRAVHGVDKARAVPGIAWVEVVAGAGDRIRTLPEHSQQNVGYIAATGSSYTAVRGRLAEAVGLVEVTME